MSPQQFETLVRRLDARARRYPRLYRLQVIGLLMLGYLYLSGVVVIALALSLGFAILCVLKPVLLPSLLKVIWAPAWLAWSVLSALWIRFDPPGGIELKRTDAPALFAEVDALRKRMKSPTPHRILLTDEFNAGVLQLPRLGILGWPRNYLMVGLPMMAAMSPDQFRAVLAHEFGHLSAGDSRMSGRIYQQRTLWARLQAQFEQRSNWVFSPFMNRFAPYFNAYSFVLARAQEYAADRAAASIVGQKVAGEALVVASLGAEHQLENIWKPLWDRVRVEGEPTQLPYARLLGETTPLDRWNEVDDHLGKAMDRETDCSDTHPSLKDRLAALDVLADVPAVQTTAANALLGDRASVLAGELDQLWQLRVAGGWRERYRECLVQREQLTALEQTQQAAALSQEQRWQLAWLTEQVRDANAALPLYRAFNAEQPDDARGAFALGRILLAAGDEAGLPLLDRAMELDGDAIKPAAELAHRFLTQRKRRSEAEKYGISWQRRDSIERMATRERAAFSPDDRYEAHGLPEANVIVIRDALRSLRFVRKAWLVRKRVSYLPEKPAFLLFVRKRSFSRVAAETAVIQIRQALNLGDNVIVAVYAGKFSRLWKTVTKIKAGQIAMN